MNFNFSEYMLNIATTLKALSHSDTNPCFSKVSSLPKLEEFLGNIRSNKGLQLVIVDTHTGRFDDSSKSDNLLDHQLYTFFLFRNVTINDHAERQQTLIEITAILHSILSKFMKDRKEYNLGLEHLKRSSINYDTIGPIGNNCHGLMVHFTINSFPDLTFDAEKWL